MRSNRFLNLPYYIALLTPFFAIFFIIPFELYYYQMDFWNYNLFFPLIFCVSGIVIYLGLIVLLNLARYKWPRFLKRFSTAMFLFGLFVLLITNFSISDHKSFTNSFITFIAVLLIIGLLIVTSIKKHDLLMRICTLLNIALALLSIYYIFVIATSIPPTPTKKVPIQANAHHELIKGNVYHIVLDQMQSDAFLRYLEEKQTERYFSGFTWYRYNYSNYILTSASFNSFMTGSLYQHGNYLSWRNSYKHIGLLHDLYTKGYKLTMYIPWYFWFENPYASEVKDVNSFVENNPSITIGMLNEFVKNWITRLIPDLLDKKFFTDKTFQLFPTNRAPKIPRSLEEGSCPYASVKMLKKLIITEKYRNPNGQYLYVHPVLPHDPYVFDETGKFDLRLREKGKQGYYSQLKYTMVLVTSYLKELKRLGRYDNSTIIIQSDHGAAIWEDNGPDYIVISSQGNNAVKNVLNNSQNWTINQIQSRAKSLLLVKPANHSGKLQHSRRPTQLIDLYPTLIEILKLKPSVTNIDGISLFKDPGLKRETGIYFFTPNPFLVSKPNFFIKLNLENPSDYHSKLVIQHVRKIQRDDTNFRH